MAVYRVYNSILFKLENVFLRVESEVNREIASVVSEYSCLNQQLVDLKSKIELLNSLKRSVELDDENGDELGNLNRSLFRVLADKQILLRLLQEQELLLQGYLLAESSQLRPTAMQLNKELKIRKQLQEAELLTSFLAEDTRFAAYKQEIEEAYEIFDLGIESGANDKLERVIVWFQNFFERVVNLYELEESLVDDFRDFRAQISLQARNIKPLTPTSTHFHSLSKAYYLIRQERVSLGLEVNKLLYQFIMVQGGKGIILASLREASRELESVLFKEYTTKQKIQELKQYKAELHMQKDSFMKDFTVDVYSEAVHRLECVESRFRRLTVPKRFEKSGFATRFFTGHMSPIERQMQSEEHSMHSKILFQALHNDYISSQDKAAILRLSKPFQLIRTHSGKLFCRRNTRTGLWSSLHSGIKKMQVHQLH